MKDFFIHQKSKLLSSENEKIERWKTLSYDQRKKLILAIKDLSNVIILAAPATPGSLYLDHEEPTLKLNENNFYGKVIQVIDTKDFALDISENGTKKIFLKQRKLGIPSFVDVVLRQNENGEDIYDITVTTLHFEVKYYDYNNEKYKLEKIYFNRIIPFK